VRNKAGFLIAAIKDDYAAPEFRTNSHSHNTVALEEKPGNLTSHLEEPASPLSQEITESEGVEGNMPFQTGHVSGEEHSSELAKPTGINDQPIARTGNPSPASHED
jgi:hypothetical protein